MIKSTTKKNVLGAIALSAVLPIAAQAAQTLTWDGSAGDGLWTTGANWTGSTTNGIVPTSGDTVNISNGDTVTSLINNFPSGIFINLTGDSTLDRPDNVIRFNGATIDVASGSGLTGNGFWDLNGGTLSFGDESIATMANWEQKGTNIFSYNLGASGFQALTPGAFRFGGGATIANATYNVDMASYTGGLGIITLMDFGSDAGSMDNATFQGAGGLNVLNNGGYTANLQWNDTTEAIELNITAVPEPSSAALLGLGGVALILRRRK